MPFIGALVMWEVYGYGFASYVSSGYGHKQEHISHINEKTVKDKHHWEDKRRL